MEALSPTFGRPAANPGVKPASPVRTPTAPPAAALAVLSVSLPLRFVLFGLVSLFAGAVLLAARPSLLATYHYSREIGRRKVPALADLYSPRLQAAGYWTFLAGLIATSVAIVAGSGRAMPWCCGLLLAGLLVFAANVVRMLSHLVRPRLEPLAGKTITTPPK
jgi:hypothetical protein